jgi:hypothetical protein
MGGWSGLRRKFLLGLDLLDWRRQTAILRAETPPSADKTFLAGSLLTIPATLKAEALYARTLQMRGYRPVFALSEAASYNTALLRALLGDAVRIVTPLDYAQHGDELWARDEAAVLLSRHATLENFLQLEVGDVRVGRNSLSTVVRQLRASHVDFAKPDHLTCIRAALEASLLATRRFSRLLDDVRPDAALFNERGYTPSGELFDSCLVRGVNTIQWLGAPQADHLLYKRYTLATRGQHPLALSDETWARLSKASWTVADETRLMTKLASHYESGAWFNRQKLQDGKAVMCPAEVRAHLGVAAGTRIAVIFSHILYDATFFYGDSLYADYATWLVETVRAAIANTNIHWVVKVHPVNVWRSKMDNAPLEQLEARLLREAFGELPSHVSIMPADTPVNTYALFQTIDYGLTVRGTVGMELPCYGIPTVTAGTGRYSGRGFTIDPATSAEYQALLARLHTVPRLAPKVVTLARRYAFGTFFLRPQRIYSFRILYNARPPGSGDLQTHFVIRQNGPLEGFRDLLEFCDFATSKGGNDFLSGGAE